MYKSASSQQLGIFGDGWIYKAVLEQTKDNPLIKLRPVVDKVLSNADTKLKAYYSLYEGRPSFSPACIFKMILLEYLYNLSDVQVSRICVHDFLFRWFIGLDPTEPVPDDTTLVKFRGRLKEEGFQEIFDELVKVAKEQGLIKGKLRAIDGTHVFSDTPKPRPIALIKQGVRNVLKEIKKVHVEAATQLEKKYKPWLKKSTERGREKIGEARRKGKRFVEDAREEALRLVSTMNRVTKRAGKKAIERMKVIVDVLENVVNGNSLQIVSFTDLDARWGRKSPKMLFGGYKIHALCDVESGFVSSLETLHGNVNEGERLPGMVEQERQKQLETEALTGDKLYDSADNRKYLKSKEIRAFIPSRFAHSEIDKFEQSGGRVKCKAGRYSIGKIRQERGELYYFSTADCGGCRFRNGCIKENEVRKRVWLSDCKRLREKEDRESCKQRYVIERDFGQAKRWYGLDRARYRGQWRVGVQALMTFFAMNLKLVATDGGNLT